MVCSTMPSSPMRDRPCITRCGVLANGDGSEVVFTLFQREDMSDDETARDAAMVARDFAVLKALLEG